MGMHIKTGDKTLDEMLKAVTERFSADAVGLCICAHGVPIPKDAERVIVLYDEDSYISSEAHTDTSKEYGENYTCIKTPVSIPEFEAALRMVYDAPRVKITNASAVKYDRTSGTVSKNGVTARLSAKECMLFELLWKKKGCTVSRKTLRENLWQNTDGTNAPDVYISYLRRKLTPVMGEGALVSIRGKGYMLKDE